MAGVEDPPGLQFFRELPFIEAGSPAMWGAGRATLQFFREPPFIEATSTCSASAVRQLAVLSETALH